MSSYKDYQAAVRERMRKNAENREKKGGITGKGLLDLSQYEDVNFFKPSTEKKNLIDILLYQVTSANHPGGVEKGQLDYILDVWFHGGVGTLNSMYVCPLKMYGRPCPICEERDARMKSGLAWDSPEVQEVTPQRRAYYNIIDLNDPQKGIQIFSASYALFEREMLEMAEKAEAEFITFADLTDGRTVEFWASSAKWGKRTFLKYKSFSFAHRDEPYDESVIKETYPLDEMLIVSTYDEIRDAFYGMDDNPEEKEGNAHSDTPSENTQVMDEDPKPNDPSPPATIPGKTIVGRGKKKAEETPKKEEPTTAPSASPNSSTVLPDEKGCPFGHQFGVDIDKDAQGTNGHKIAEDCLECSEWTDCAGRARELKRTAKK